MDDKDDRLVRIVWPGAHQAGGPGAAIVNGQFIPQENMVVIIPQSMQRGGFSSDVIRRVISDSAVQLAAKGIELDADRIYLTGLSMRS